MCTEYRPDRLRFLGGDSFFVFFGGKRKRKKKGTDTMGASAALLLGPQLKIYVTLWNRVNDNSLPLCCNLHASL